MKKLAISVLAAAILASCGGNGKNTTSNGGGGDDNNDNSPVSPVSGVAAIGAPIVGGTVEFKCASGATSTATTAATGAWSITTLREKDYPCAVRVAGGTQGGNWPNDFVFHSMALTGGNVNITPLTDLMVAALTNEVPNIWFDNLDVSLLKGQVTDASLAAALTELSNGLDDITGAPTLPQGFNPITTAFKAEDDDPFDELLDQFRTAYAEQGLHYATVVGNAALGIELSTENDYATAYTFPASQGGIRLYFESFTNKLLVVDPRRGTKSGTIASGGSQQISGDFSGIVVSGYMGARIAQLCIGSNGGMKGQYAYMNNRAVEVPVSELKGKEFSRAENCASAGGAIFNNDGSMTLSNDGQYQIIPAEQVDKLFSKEGLKANGRFEKARAYKIDTMDDGVKYYYIHSGSIDPFVNDETGNNFIFLAEEASL